MPRLPSTLVAVLVLFALASPAQAQNLCTVPALATPPTIDGALGDDEWAGAAVISCFVASRLTFRRIFNKEHQLVITGGG